MIQFLLAAPHSGSGKTVMTCAMLALLKKRGLNPCTFKCGPDYIDPMFHRAVLGLPSHNLDLFFSDEDRVRRLYGRYAQGCGAAVVEGVMGYYDGLGGTTARASAWQLADTLRLPALLVLRPKGASLTLAAQVKGLQSFRSPSRLAGILLNDCSPMLARTLGPMLEAETGLPVLGSLPHLPEAAFESRHLGLYTAGEITDLKGRIDRCAAELEKALDWEKFCALCDGPAPAGAAVPEQGATVTIAVARDEAFCFTYEETLDALRAAGAELVFFSPLGDGSLPEGIGGLYLPGGYPELYARALSGNGAMLAAVRRAVAGGLPTVAECGGFLYLGRSLEGADGEVYPMAGVLPGQGQRREKLVRFGYASLRARADSLLLRAGEQIPVHEFHYWDSTANGCDFTATKPLTGRCWDCGFGSKSLYAAFPHLYFDELLSRRFVQAAKTYQEESAYETF
ncbi:MAG: cobyrinate a,c-diamide synthase [Eubacteriales bacterium]|nr:cobyrinate a,c-diamide synthase [Eubacteriales bacterium]